VDEDPEVLNVQSYQMEKRDVLNPLSLQVTQRKNDTLHQKYN